MCFDTHKNIMGEVSLHFLVYDVKNWFAFFEKEDYLGFISFHF